MSDDASEKMAFWMKKAAAAGHLDAQFGLGFSYLATKATLPEGIALLQKAAEQGHVDALSELGRCFNEGIGVDADAEVCAPPCTKKRPLSFFFVRSSSKRCRSGGKLHKRTTLKRCGCWA